MTNNPQLSHCCKAFIHSGYHCDGFLGHRGKECDCTMRTDWNECMACNKPCAVFVEEKGEEWQGDFPWEELEKVPKDVGRKPFLVDDKLRDLANKIKDQE